MDEVRGIEGPDDVEETPRTDAGEAEGLPDNRQWFGLPSWMDGADEKTGETQAQKRAAIAERITRYARWEYQRARAWEDEIKARIAVANYHRLMQAQQDYERGVVNADQYRREVLDEAWDEAETAMETNRGRRKVLMRDYVSLKRTKVGTKDGQTQPVYAAVAGRYWLGERGASDMIAGSGFLYQPVLIEDKDEVLSDVQQRFRQNVAEQLAQRWGLEVMPASENLDNIEWLVIWECDETTVERVRSFEQGWGVRPKGLDKPASELTGADIRRIVAMQGHKITPHRGTPLTAEESHDAMMALGHALDEDEGAPLVEQRQWGSGVRERVVEDDDATE